MKPDDSTASDRGAHTAEPWVTDRTICTHDHPSRFWACNIEAPNGWVGYAYGFTQEEAEANARRIVACINACAGISTDTLEVGSVQINQFRRVHEEREALSAELARAREALQGMLDAFSLETDIGIDASMKRLEAKKQARAALASTAKKEET